MFFLRQLWLKPLSAAEHWYRGYVAWPWERIAVTSPASSRFRSFASFSSELLAAARYLASLPYGVKAAQPGMLAMPLLAILAIASSATQPVVALALRTEPAEILRAE